RSDGREPSGERRIGGRRPRPRAEARSRQNLLERRADAARCVAGTNRHDRRRSVHANLAHKWTARSEAASPRERGHVRHYAVDGGELVDAPIEPLNGAEEPEPGGRAPAW